MFTGIITGLGRILEVQDLGATAAYGKRLKLQAPAGYLDDVLAGDSIALDGACMTVTTFDVAAATFEIDVSAESLDKTSGLDRLHSVNLEKALRAGDRLGGHIVSGHVDGIGTVERLQPVGESHDFRVLAPAGLGRYLAYKGSITVNGVSLTVNRVEDGADGTTIFINLIPHTLENTSLGRLSAGDRVNLEIDTVARYVARMLEGVQLPPANGIPA
ncbi:riboflavin synthase [Xylophilus sp. Kf1]|nr:riboflavin synthase [Xylophilus sp. Kf1]